MKICVMNLSGNVGKTTLAIHLLGAFNTSAKIISVESINNSSANEMESLDVEELAASRFKEIYREIMMNDDVIIDVGASNVAAFMTEITRFKGVVGEFDMVLVPTVPADKQQKDTNATIDWLNSLGIDGKKVRVILNQYNMNTLEPVELVYSQVFGYGMSDGKGKAIYEPHAIIAHNEIYEMVKPLRKTIKEIAGANIDWKQKREDAKKSGDKDALESAMEGQMSFDLAGTANENLSLVHSIIFPAKNKK